MVDADNEDTGEHIPRTVADCIEQMLDEHSCGARDCWVCHWCNELERVDPARGGWVKLRRGNDWGKVFFLRPGETHSGSCASGIRWKPGQMVRVRFPDGSKATLPLVSRKNIDFVGEQGQMHSSRVDSDVPGIEVDARGSKFYLPLDAVEVWRLDWVDEKPTKGGEGG